jgi:hypothetical protein
MVQYGLDVYAAARLGARWEDLGGHNHGRKMPLILAGLALHSNAILDYADATRHFIFQEDRQTWFVRQSDVGRPLYHADGRLREEYLPQDVGVPEWGEQHIRQPVRDGRNWNAWYRRNVGASLLGHILTARLMKVENYWKWPALFAYMDRFFKIEEPRAVNSANHINLFERDMWRAYRQLGN